MTAESAGGYAEMTAAERQFLLDSGAPANSFDPDVQAAARAALAVRAELTRVSAARELDVSEVASLLGCSASTVRRWATAGDLYAVQRETKRRFPEWQFHERQRLPGLREVLHALPASMHPLSVEGVMTTPQEELDDRSPVEWLAAGEPAEPVVWVADSVSRT